MWRRLLASRMSHKGTLRNASAPLKTNGGKDPNIFWNQSPRPRIEGNVQTHPPKTDPSLGARRNSLLRHHPIRAPCCEPRPQSRRALCPWYAYTPRSIPLALEKVLTRPPELATSPSYEVSRWLTGGDGIGWVIRFRYLRETETGGSGDLSPG
ncbi:unnamed protein product [Larinioides sclopetarius]|uniref:Uncharacterized protein n=1 Tax=Larinioides sclopetarius TaxID=280406 RepID=A0AAV1Z9A5_9ARAC